MADVEWHGTEFTSRLARIAVRNVSRAVVFAEGKVRASMRKGGRRKAKGGGLRTVHSRPGEVPFVQTGRLRASITTRVRSAKDGVTGAYGSNISYARRLERGFLGTDRAGRRVAQEARPYLRPVLVKWRAQIVKLLTARE